MTNELLKFNSKRIKSISNFVEKAIFANWYFLIFRILFFCKRNFNRRWPSERNRWNFRKLIKKAYYFEMLFLDLNFYRVPMWTRSQIVYLTKSDLNLSLKPHLRLKKYSKNFTAKTKVAPNAIFGMKFDFRLKVCSKNTRSLMTTRALPRPSLTFEHSIWNFFSHNLTRSSEITFGNRL